MDTIQVDWSRSAGRHEVLARGKHGPPERLLTVREAAALLSVSEKTMRRLIGAHRIKCIRFGRMVRLEQADVVGFVEARKE
jgi:excisionase family DNA binding protein